MFLLVLKFVIVFNELFLFSFKLDFYFIGKNLVFCEVFLIK